MPVSRLPSPLSFYRESFVGLTREVWLISVVAFVHRSGTMVLPFLALYLTSQKGLTVREAGGILSLYGVGAIGGSYVGGWLSDRIGSIQTQKVSLVLAAVGFICLSQMSTATNIASMVVVLSIVAESFRPANAATLVEVSPAALQVRAFSLRRMAMNLGVAIGPAVGGLLVVYSYTLLFFVEASVCLLSAGLLWILFREQAVHPDEERPSTDILASAIPEQSRNLSPWRDGTFLIVAGLTMLLVTVLFQLFGAYPLTLYEVYQLPEYSVGLVFTLNTLTIVVFQMVVIRLVERYDVLRVVGVGAVLLCGGFGLLPFTSTLPLIGLTVLVWTTGEMLTTPLLEGFVANRSPVESRGQYMGIFSAAFSGAFVLAPLGGTWIYEEFGYRALWFTCTGVGVGLWMAFTLLSAQLKR